MFDLVVVAILVLSFVRGFRRGFVYELAGVLTLGLGLWGAVKYSGTMEGYITPFASDIPVPTGLLAFALTLIGIIIVVHYASRLVSKVVDMTILSVPNKLAGGLLRAGRNAFVMSLLTGLAERVLPTGEGSLLGGLKSGSFTYPRLEELSAFIFPYVTEGFEKAKDIII